jgi:hypothetical protein
MPVEKSHLGESSLDPTTGFGANGSLMRASNSGALSGHASGVIGIAIIALLALAIGAVFAMTRPARLTVLPDAVAKRVPTLPATAPGTISPVRVSAAVQTSR